uniref:Uncharacterized protein n=1 Tax=Vespula pensylvanica TaxID=30213 RepID=A0A834NBD9_VESPE|nr:hypothetical protein H0235_015280 [Vespula pensylvanica]
MPEREEKTTFRRDIGGYGDSVEGDLGKGVGMEEKVEENGGKGQFRNSRSRSNDSCASNETSFEIEPSRKSANLLPVGWSVVNCRSTACGHGTPPTWTAPTVAVALAVEVEKEEKEEDEEVEEEMEEDEEVG